MQLTRYTYTVEVEAPTAEQADKVIEARIGHDEDLSEDGVEDYRIYVSGSAPYDPFGESIARD